MATKRSPICPALSLPDCIEKTERIYSVVGKNTFAGEVAVMHMGYKGLNGASRTTLGALRSFGLIEGRGVDLGISADAVVIIADAQSPEQGERQASLLRALRHNRIFRDLNDQFGQGSTLPAITSLLQKKYGFRVNAARKTAKNYKDSIAIINWGGIHSATINGDLSRTAGDPGNSPIRSGYGSGNTVSPTVGNNPAPDLHGVKEDTFVLSEGCVRLLWPQKMTKESFGDFTDWLLLMHRKISRDVKGGADCILEKRTTQP